MLLIELCESKNLYLLNAQVVKIYHHNRTSQTLNEQLRIAKFIYIVFKQKETKHCTKLSIINKLLIIFDKYSLFQEIKHCVTCIYSINCMYTCIYTYDYVFVYIWCGH